MPASNLKKTAIAILTRPDFKSPRILAESLQLQIEKAGSNATIFLDIDVLTRLNSYSENKKKINFQFWLRKKIINFFRDRKLLRQLALFDAVVICECTPNGFWKDFYHIEKLKTIIRKPVLFYEVYFLGNAPTQIKKLEETGDALIERYDWHLAVTEVTEIRSNPGKFWSCIGIDISKTGLCPQIKEEFIALVDFIQPGYERYQEEQISVLNELNIKTIVLDRRYTIEEIREIYKKASVFFIQFPEAFGMPIAECLACGAQIFTADSGWPMAWRLDENPEVHGSGILPECFTVYNDRQDLINKLTSFKNTYDSANTSNLVFNQFIKQYPHLFYGNHLAMIDVLERIRENRFTE